MNPFDQFDAAPAAGQESANPFDQFDAGVPPKKQNKNILGDIGTGLKRGVEQMPGMVAGIGDIVAAPVSAATGINRPFSRAADYIGEKTGFQPGKWAEQAAKDYSPEMQQSLKNVEQANGFGGTLKAIAENPRSAVNLIAESLPSTLAGGVLARGAMGAVAGAERLAAMKAAGDTAGLLKAGAIAGGIGEGVVTAGQQMSQTDYNVDPLRAAGAATAAGIGTGIIGGVSGRIANKLGLADIEGSIAAGTLGAGKKAGAGAYAGRIAGGAVQEGALEEMPQSAQEQVWQNLANGKPWDEGVGKASAQGLVAGMAMGAGVNALPGSSGKQEAAPPIVPPARDSINLITDPAPLQGRIDSLLGIGDKPMSDAQRAQYAKDLEASFGEVVGYASGANGLEVPVTMEDYLRSTLSAADMTRDKPLAAGANDQSANRLNQLADEEATQQPDIAPAARGIAAAPVIPVVGPLSAVANMAVQSGAHQATAMQQAAAEQAKTKPAGPLSSVAKQSEQTNGPIATQAAAEMAAPGNQAQGGELPGGGILQSSAPTGDQGRIGGGAEVAAPGLRPAVSAGIAGGQAPSAVTPSSPAGDPFIQSRTDAQLNWLAERGKPELKAAAIAEIQKRAGQVSAEPEIPNGDGVTNAPTDTGIPMSAANAPSRMFDPKGLQPGTPEYNAAFDAWNSERAQSQSDDSGNGQREENKSAVAKKNGWRKRLIDWFNGASHGDTITTDIEGEQYQVVEKTITRNGKQIKQKLLVEKNGSGEGSDRVIIENRDGESHQAPNTNQGIDEFAGNAAQPETETDSKGASLGKLLEEGVAKTSTANQEPVKNAAPSAATVSAETVAPSQDPIKKDTAVDAVPPALETIAERLGVTITRSKSGFHASADGKQVAVPQEDADAAGAVSANHVLAHELGHVVVSRRNMSFKGMPTKELTRLIPNWLQWIGASKAFRPGVWNHENQKIRDHAKKPSEIIADTLASVMMGIKPVSLIDGFMKNTGTTLSDIGLQSIDEANAEYAKRKGSPAAEPKASPEKESETLAKEMAGFVAANDPTMALRKLAHTKKQDGDVELGNEKFVTLEQAVSAAKNSMDPADWSKPFQFNRQLDIAPVDWNTMVGAMKNATGDAKKQEEAKPVSEKVETDQARIQEIKNSIAEGELILKSGKTVSGRKMSQAELDTVQRSVDSGKQKIGVAILSQQYGKAIPESEQLSVGAITEEIQNLLKPFATEIPVLVRDTLGDIGVEGTDDGVTSGAVYNGRIHLFRDGLADRSAVVRTLWHEMLHFGLRRFMDEKQYIAKMNELYQADGWIRNKADAWVNSDEAKGIGKGKPLGYVRARAVDEALAELAETMQTQPTGFNNNTFIAKTKRAVSEWVAKLADLFGFTEAAQSWRSYAAQKDARDLIVSTFAKLRKGAPPSMLTSEWHYSDPAFMTAWHGSPHDHDKFDSSKIGTGEGAQAYGHGLYFAGDKAVAEHYRKALSESQIALDGEPLRFQSDDFANALRNIVRQTKNGIAFDQAIDDEASVLESSKMPSRLKDAEKLRSLREGSVSEVKQGRLYQVDLAPGQDEYLDWDKPLSKQSEVVKKAIRPMVEMVADDIGDSFDTIWNDMAGTFYKIMAQSMSPKVVSNELHSIGIRGIRYLDGASRNRPIKEIKAEFLAELPEDAETDEVMDLVGTGRFSPKNEALIKALVADDWLGFDYPSQAISAALGNGLSNFDASPALLQAVSDAKDGGTSNYVIFNDADVSITVKYNKAGNDKLTQADTAIYGMAAEGKSAAEILKFIASASRSPFNRQVAKLLLKTGIAPSVTVGDGKGWKMNAGEGNKYAAGYNPKTDTISLFRPASAERNMLHEMMHAATLKALAKKGMASAQMNALYAHVKKTGSLKGMYGMSDIDEFVAEAFSNPKFQEMLKKVAAPQGSSALSSAWNWFIRIIRGILGVPQGQENALSQALEIGLGVMREDADLRKDEKRSGAYTERMAKDNLDPDNDEAMRVQAAIEGKSSVAVAQWISKTGSMAERMIAAKVLDRLQALESAGVNLKFKVAHVGDSIPRSLLGARGVTSYKFGKVDPSVDVWINGADVTGKVGTSVRTVLHELVHAATMGAIRLGNLKAANGTKLANDVSDLYDVSNAIISHFNQRIAASKAGKVTLTDFEQSMFNGENNALRDVHETLAWALTDAGAQAYLESIPYKSKSAWTAFVAAIRKFLSLPPSADTALSEVLRVAEAIMSDNINDMVSMANLTGTAMAIQESSGHMMRENMKLSESGGDTRYALNGDKSKPKQTDSEAFRKWFGDSKVVDANGEPLTVYHGTKNDFSAFLPDSHFGTKDQADSILAEKRGKIGKRVMPVYLSIQKMKRVKDQEIAQRWADVVATAKRQGYDGLVYKNEYEGDGTADSYVVFDPTQIKSAIGNSGDFDASNPDIRYNITGDSGRSYDQAHRDFFKNVGRDADTKGRIEKTLDYLKNDFWKKMAVGIVDQFRGLRDLGDGGQAYMLARLSKGTAGAFETLLHHGKLSIKDGVYDGDKSGGFIERLGVPLHGELDDFLWYVAANRAEGLAKHERENLFTPEDIAAGKSLANGTTNFDYTIQTGPGKGKVTRVRSMIYADANRVFNEFQKNTLDIAEQSGLIDGANRKFWESEFYVPFYRVSEEDGEFIGAKMGQSLVRQQAFKKLKGGTDKLNSDLLSNTLLNWSHLIEASAKNRAAKATLTAAEQVGAAHKATYGEKKTVWYMGDITKTIPAGQEYTENGVTKISNGTDQITYVGKVEYGVDDPFVMTAITSLEYAGMRNVVMDVMTKFKHWLTIGVTASPAFKVRNLIRDSVQAIGTSDLGYNPIKNVVDGFKQSSRDKQEYVSALASGGLIRFGTMLEGSESSRVRQLIKSGVKDSTILDSEPKWQQFYDKYLEPGISAYNELGNRSEEINRAALFNQLIKQGKSHAEAALLARDLMDFSMQGSFNTIRFLTQIVPFMNARLQGLYKLGRSAKDNPRKLAIVTGAVAMASIALMLGYDDDDDWKRREDFDRDNFWWFKFGGVEFRIPKPFEVGAVATLAERSVEYMINDEMTGERFRKVVSDLVMHNLSMNPVPQAIKPIVDLYANKDSFTGRPIETMSMQRLDPTMRYNSNTSLVARGLSTATGGLASPVQYDHMARAYFGWLGSFVIGGADMVARPMTDEPEKPERDYWKFATQGILKEQGSGNSRYLTMVYDQANELEQAHATHRQMIKEGKLDDARDYAEDNADKLKRYRMVEQVKRAESKFNESIRAIERGDLDPDEKKLRIQRIQQMKESVAKRIAPGLQ